MKNINNAVKELSPSLYMTFVSIIQSLIIGYFVTYLDPFQFLFEGNKQSIVSWFQVSAVLQVIILIWHVYMQNVIVYSSSMTLRDSYIPFLLIFPQFYLIKTIKSYELNEWLRYISIFVFIAIIAYCDMYRAYRNEPDNKKIENRLGLYPYLNLIFMAIGGFVFLLSGFLSLNNIILQIFITFIVNLFLVIFTLLHKYLFWEIIKREN